MTKAEFFRKVPAPWTLKETSAGFSITAANNQFIGSFVLYNRLHIKRSEFKHHLIPICNELLSSVSNSILWHLSMELPTTSEKPSSLKDTPYSESNPGQPKPNKP